MKRTLLMTILAGTMFAVAGCAVYPEQDPYYDYDALVVRVPPPPPLVEYVGSPPVVGYVWIGGYWNWIGTRYVWVPGRWEAPRPGYVWVPRRWERYDDHWRPHGGRWEPERRSPFSPPPPSRIEYRAPPPAKELRPPPPQAPAAPPPQRLEPRPFPGVIPRPPERPEPPRLEPENRRPMEVDLGRFPDRRAEPPRPERDDRARDMRLDERRENRHWRDRDGNGRPNVREGQRP